MSKITIDTRGQKCPIPLIKLEKQLDSCNEGDKITLLANDPIAIIDIPLYCKKNNLQCKTSKQNNVFTFTIEV